MTGGFIYPFSEFATPKDQLANRLGYQDDSSAANKEAKSLLAAAGQSSMRPLDFMVRDPPQVEITHDMPCIPIEI
jgi:hypothetical protein